MEITAPGDAEAEPWLVEAIAFNASASAQCAAQVCPMVARHAEELRHDGDKTREQLFAEASRRSDELEQLARSHMHILIAAALVAHSRAVEADRLAGPAHQAGIGMSSS
jgi:hypothetical protein